MKEIRITTEEQSGRLDKYLRRLFPQATGGFVYKMLRKKNITLNGHKATGKELLAAGDTVRVYFSDETFAKLAAHDTAQDVLFDRLAAVRPELTVLYEDEELLAIDKPAGVLTQQAKPGEVSLNERMLSYLIRQGTLTCEGMVQYKPSVVNRLDRNTSGIVLAAKTYAAARKLSEWIAAHALIKRYHCIVGTVCTLSGHVVSYWQKDDATNTVRVEPHAFDGASRIETIYSPVRTNGGVTLLEAELVTGKGHQIRAQLARLGHPILFDPKYGDRANDRRFRDPGRGQLLHAYYVRLPDGRTITADDPPEFAAVLSAGR